MSEAQGGRTTQSEPAKGKDRFEYHVGVWTIIAAVFGLPVAGITIWEFWIRQEEKPDFVSTTDYGPFDLPRDIDFALFKEGSDPFVEGRNPPYHSFLKMSVTNSGYSNAKNVRVQTGYAGFAMIKWDDSEQKQFSFTNDVPIGDVGTGKQFTLSLWTTETIIPSSSKIAIIPETGRPTEVELPNKDDATSIWGVALLVAMIMGFVLVVAVVIVFVWGYREGKKVATPKKEMSDAEKLEYFKRLKESGFFDKPKSA